MNNGQSIDTSELLDACATLLKERDDTIRAMTERFEVQENLLSEQSKALDNMIELTRRQAQANIDQRRKALLASPLISIGRGGGYRRSVLAGLEFGIWNLPANIVAFCIWPAIKVAVHAVVIVPSHMMTLILGLLGFLKYERRSADKTANR